MENGIIRWGIIGCGNVSELKSGPAFNILPNSKLLAVMRRDAVKAQSYAKRHNVDEWYSDAKFIIEHPKLDAIYIATPPSSHKAYAIAAMKAGKDVYVEKPMALNAEECEEMIAASHKYGRKLFVAYYRRYLPGFLKVKEWLEEGAIGDVLFCNITLLREAVEKPDNIPWRLNPAISGGGHFVDLASHQIDFMNFLFGQAEDIDGVACNVAGLYSAEDTVSAHIQYPGDIVVNGQWSFCSYKNEDVMEIVGTKGSVRFSGFSHDPVELCRKEGVIKSPYKNPQHIQQNLIGAVNTSILTGSECLSTGRSAIQSTKIMDRILSEYYHR